MIINNINSVLEKFSFNDDITLNKSFTKAEMYILIEILKVYLLNKVNISLIKLQILIIK